MLFLILFPVLAAVVLLLTRNEKARSIIVMASAATVAIASILLAATYYGQGLVLFDVGIQSITPLMFAAEMVLAAVLFYLGIRYKKYPASILAVIQAALVAWFEYGIGHDIHATNDLYIDGLSSIMVLIIGVIGSLIVVYAIGYMRNSRHHNPEEKDRGPWFFFLMFVFMSAMFGIVLSNNLVWLLFFWEITTICSFLLIGYTKTEKAINNSFRALTMNLLGGIGFAVAVIVIGYDLGIVEMDRLLEMGAAGAAVMLPVGLLAFAGIVKSAQMPFQSWLLGAMVAPTPVSALLHSSTMVKAGVFIVIKMSPLLGMNSAGVMVMLVGGITFLLASMAAVSQSNAKRVLAYSTVANLGLIVACAGVGTDEAVWAAIMLMIFHAATKSLLFQCVGTAQHNIGSGDIEDMDGMFSKMPRLAGLMIIGLVGMFLAPFGMLISKWAAMASFVDAENIILITCVCFGSAVTVFYWGKWLGKMVAVVAGRENIEKGVERHEWFSTGTLACLAVALCVLFPVVSDHVIVPTVQTMFGTVSVAVSSSNLYIMSAMMVLMLLLPLLFFRKNKKETKHIYMCGVNTGNNLSFTGSMGREVSVSIRNRYMQDWFGEKRVGGIGMYVTAGMIVMIIAYSVYIWAGGAV
ncbi:MAG: hypothetical protein LBH88_01580 [Candidatus Methanoplasma sp.]|jgi:ech hydrogenase subunit A|nr:hypothetical protein [Candidatus Methanoplasma sp.]